jgi:hypothetical protein
MDKGNEEKAIAALAKLETGASLAEVLSTHDLGFEIEILPGLTTTAYPKVDEHGKAHLSGEVNSSDYGEFSFHITGDAAKIEQGIRDAVANNLPLRLASWWKNNFERTPIIKRVLVDANKPKRIGVIGPNRLLRRGF